MHGRLCGWPHLPPCLRCRRLPAAAHASSPDCPRSWHHPMEGREDSAKPWSAQQGQGFPAKWLACPCPAGAPGPSPAPAYEMCRRTREKHVHPENKNEAGIPGKAKPFRPPGLLYSSQELNSVLGTLALWSSHIHLTPTTSIRPAFQAQSKFYPPW